MKTPGQIRRGCRGMVSMPAILSVAMVIGAGLAFAYRHHVQSLDNQAKVQVRLDYTQKEEALLRALLHIVPNKAIGAMQRNSRNSAQDFTWKAIFHEAAELANAETAVSSEVLDTIGGSGAILANPGDTVFSSTDDFVSAIRGAGAAVNPGLTQEASLLFDGRIGPKLPAPLECSDRVFLDDATYPLITFEKTHSVNWPLDLLLSPSDYPLYNLYSYPNIRFGYARPGQPFVAKRNWWAFTLKFGAHNQEQTGLAALEKHYVLSIYEVPSQLPISAPGFMSIGRHANGSNWGNVSLSGGVFAGRLETEGTVALVDGLLSARTSTAFSNSTTVAGRAVANDFDALGVREEREASSSQNFHEASVGGNVGRAVFVPIHRGNDFLTLHEDGPESERLSPTGWNEYSTGGLQAQMRVAVTRMESLDNQEPVQIQFHYRTAGGARNCQTYERGNNWPSEAQSGGSEFPFQTDHLSAGRRALLVHLDRLPAFVSSLGDAADLTVNNSLYVYPDPVDATVREPNFPSTADDLAVSLTGAEDMSAFTKGFSLVTNLRLYIGSSVNTTAVPPPAGSGIAGSAEYFPPVSFFAAEKRFGTGATFVHPVNLKGQVQSLKSGDEDLFRPLDFRAGNEQLVNPNLVTADLKPLRSPAELPPIHLMNWLVVIEEIFPD